MTLALQSAVQEIHIFAVVAGKPGVVDFDAVDLAQAEACQRGPARDPRARSGSAVRNRHCEMRRPRGRPSAPRPRRRPRGAGFPAPSPSWHPTRRPSDRAARRGCAYSGEGLRSACRATPESIAAFATAGGIRAISRGSNALGMMYSGPKARRRPVEAEWTSSGTSSRASFASASAAAIFIASLIVLARTSSAPRKM